MKPLYTPDRRYLIVRDRLWRATNPDLPTALRERLVHQLMNARREVKDAKQSSDADRLAKARKAVNDAKVALGERGPVWWTDGTNFHRHLVKNTPYAQWYARIQGSGE